MKTAEFLALITANTNKTNRIRTYAGPWHTGVNRLPDSFTTQIGHVIALLQTQIDKDLLCKQDEFLMIYDFSPLLMNSDNQQLYCGLSMVIKPIAEIQNTKDNRGKPLHLIINGNTGEVMNQTKGLIQMNMMDETDIKDMELEEPISYGYYQDNLAVCGFIALASHQLLSDAIFQKLFNSKLDQSNLLQEAKGFDSFIEARDYLVGIEMPGQYVGELVCPKEQLPYLKQQGNLGKSIIKIIDFKDKNIEITPDPSIQHKEDSVEDEISRLHEAMTEPEISVEHKISFKM